MPWRLEVSEQVIECFLRRRRSIGAVALALHLSLTVACFVLCLPWELFNSWLVFDTETRASPYKPSNTKSDRMVRIWICTSTLGVSNTVISVGTHPEHSNITLMPSTRSQRSINMRHRTKGAAISGACLLWWKNWIFERLGSEVQHHYWPKSSSASNRGCKGS